MQKTPLALSGKKLLPASAVAVILIALAVIFWPDRDTESEKAAGDSAATHAPSPASSPPETSPPHPVSLPALMQKDFDGRDLVPGRVLGDNQYYTRYFITYTSGNLSISGIMNVPKTAVPEGGFPVLILNHGYIDPAIYTNGRGLRREQDYFARQGFAVIHPDYRNHAQSDKDPEAENSIRLGYVEDVINAVYAVKNSQLPYLSKENIGMLGHSMGGGVTQAVMVVQPDLIDAVVLYAPVSMDTRDSYERWLKSRPETAARIIELYGAPETAPEFWDNISPQTFVDRVAVPVLLFHGDADESVPLEWSQRTEKLLEDAGKQVELITYKGQPHEFSTAWPDFMQKSRDFFLSNLKK